MDELIRSARSLAPGDAHVRPPRGDTLVHVFAALGDETRWSILTVLGAGAASASTLAERLPVTRQAISRHLAVLEAVGVVESVRTGRELRFRVVAAELAETARRLDVLGFAWDPRLASLDDIADGL